MKLCKPDKGIRVQKIKIDTGHRKIPALILMPKQQKGQRIGQQSESDTKLEPKQNSEPRTCVLWLHGGGLCAALCMMARDKGEVKIAYQMPLYPMMDNFDAESSRNNHGRVWNTWKNHFSWRIYLRKNAKKEVSPYAAAARQTNYKGLPPAYTFVGIGEPFYCETLQYIENLRKCGIEAEVTVYESDMHAFDMMDPESELAKQAAEQFNAHFARALKEYFT